MPEKKTLQGIEHKSENDRDQYPAEIKIGAALKVETKTDITSILVNKMTKMEMNQTKMVLRQGTQNLMM